MPMYRARMLLLIVCTLLISMSACGEPDKPSSSQPVAVNGFGTRANHVHSLLSLPDNVLVLATHYGLYRSANNGQSWTLVAAGPDQLMDGMMTYSMVASWQDPQRLYVLTQPSINNAKGVQGLYVSSDQGQTWKLAQKTADFGDMYLAASGNRSADEIYIYSAKQQANGLKVSQDGGQTFASPGKLPYARILGMLALPKQPGALLVYGNDGASRSVDGGKTWTPVQGLEGAVYNMATAGAKQTIYATGDAGLYVSRDDGKSFSLVYDKTRFGNVIVSPKNPQVLYAKTGQMIYQSTDGAKTWNTLPKIKGNLESMAADVSDASRLYLSLSYPSEVHRYDQKSTSWLSLTPPKS